MNMEDSQWRAILPDRYKLVFVTKEKEGDAQSPLFNDLQDLQEDPFELRYLYHDPAHINVVLELIARHAGLFANLVHAAP